MVSLLVCESGETLCFGCKKTAEGQTVKEFSWESAVSKKETFNGK